MARKREIVAEGDSDPFPESEYADTEFDARTVSKARLVRKRFTACAFRGVVFEETGFVDSQFEECVFRDCAFLLPQWKGLDLRSVRFEGCKFVGMALTQASLHSFLAGFFFTACRLLSCQFTGLPAMKMAFPECRFSECRFAGCDLTGVDFRRAGFETTGFADCTLVEADFRDAAGFWIDPRENRLKGARFSYAAAAELLAPLQLRLE